MGLLRTTGDSRGAPPWVHFFIPGPKDWREWVIGGEKRINKVMWSREVSCQLDISQDGLSRVGRPQEHPSPSTSPIATWGTEVAVWVGPQDEIESHRQELQQGVFQLWELSHPCKTLWLFPMASWPAVASPRASATVPETMGQRHPVRVSIYPFPF